MEKDVLDSRASSDAVTIFVPSSTNKPPVYTYTREELLALANAAQCKRHLDGLDPIICRTSGDDERSEAAGQRLAPAWAGEGRGFLPRKDSDKRLPNNLPEWRKDSWRAGGGATSGQNRRPYDDKSGSGTAPILAPTNQGQRQGWANGNQRTHYDRFNHGPGAHPGGNRWDPRGDAHTTQTGRSKPLWNMEHNDGVRGNNHNAVHGRPDSQFKNMGSPHREAFKEDTGLYNDGETFGNDQARDIEMVEQERKRRESFELMREEARRKNLDRRRSDPDELHKRRSHEDSIWDTNLSTEDGDHDSSDKSLSNPATLHTPAIPPGFSTPPGFEKVMASINEKKEAETVEIARDPVLNAGTSNKSVPIGRWGDDVEREEEQRVQGISSLEVVEGMALALENAGAGNDESRGGGGDDPAKEWSFESMFGPSPFLAGTAGGKVVREEPASVLDDLFSGVDRNRLKPSTKVDLEALNDGNGDSKFARWFTQGAVEGMPLNDDKSKALLPPTHDGTRLAEVASLGGHPVVAAPAAASAAILSLLGKKGQADGDARKGSAAILAVPPHTTTVHARANAPPPVHAPARESRRPVPMPTAPSLEDIERAMAADAEAGSFVPAAAVSPLGMLQEHLQDMLANSINQGGGGMRRISPANAASAAAESAELMGWFSNQQRGPVDIYFPANPRQRVMAGPGAKGLGPMPPARPADLPMGMKTLSEIEESLLAESSMETKPSEEDGSGGNILGSLFSGAVAPGNKENDVASNFLLSLLQGKGEGGGGGAHFLVDGGGIGKGESALPPRGHPQYAMQGPKGKEMGGPLMDRGVLKKGSPAPTSASGQARVKVGPRVGPVSSAMDLVKDGLLPSGMTSKLDEGLPGGHLGGDSRLDEAVKMVDNNVKAEGVSEQGQAGIESKENMTANEDGSEAVKKGDGEVEVSEGCSHQIILKEEDKAALASDETGVTGGKAEMVGDGDASLAIAGLQTTKPCSSGPTALVVGEALASSAGDCPDSPGDIDGALSLAASVAALALSGLSPISERPFTPDPTEGTQVQKGSPTTIAAAADSTVSSQANANMIDASGRSGDGERPPKSSRVDEVAVLLPQGTAEGGRVRVDGYSHNESGVYGQQHPSPVGLAASLMLNPHARPPVHAPLQSGLLPGDPNPNNFQSEATGTHSQGKESLPRNLRFLGQPPSLEQSIGPGTQPTLEPPQVSSHFGHAGQQPFAAVREEVVPGGGGGLANMQLPSPLPGGAPPQSAEHGRTSPLRPTAGQGQQQHVRFGELPTMGPLPGGMPVPYHTHPVMPPPPFAFMHLPGPYFPPLAYMQNLQRMEPGTRLPPSEAWMPGGQQGHQGGIFAPPPPMGLPMHQVGGVPGGLPPQAGQLEGLPFGMHSRGTGAQYPPAAHSKGLDFTPPPGFSDGPLQAPALDKWLEAFGRPSRMPMAPPPGIQPMSLEELEQKLRVA